MPDLGATFLAIFSSLKLAISQCLTQDRAVNDRLGLVHHRLSRTAGRLFHLLHRWKTNTLPKPRPTRAGRKAKPRPPRPDGIPPFPRGRGWLAKAGWQVRVAATQFDPVLRDPAFAEFLAAAPQAGRLLRPVLHLLRLDPPPAMALPPPAPRKPRPRKPRLRRDPKPPRIRGGIVARNRVRDIAGWPKFVIDTS